MSGRGLSKLRWYIRNVARKKLDGERGGKVVNGGFAWLVCRRRGMRLDARDDTEY